MASLIRRKDPGQAWETEVDTGGGGSQPGASITLGPYPLEFSDIEDNLDEHNFVTLPVGAAVLAWWVDPGTYVAFESESAVMDSNLFLCQIAAADFLTQAGQWGYMNIAKGNPGDPPGDSYYNIGASDVYYDDAVEAATSFRIIGEVSPVRAKNTCGVTLDAGHLDFYLLVSIPTLSVPT